MYDPTVGRWLNEDSLGFEAGDTNLDRYVANRATTAVDPMGLYLEESGGSQGEDGGGVFRFAFGQPKPVVLQLVAAYRDEFLRMTPDMPSDWRVHHIYGQRETISKRLKEAGYDPFDVKNMRGINSGLHDEITAIQNKFWTAQAKEHGSLPAAYEKVPISDVLKMVEEIESRYGKYWIAPGATEAEIRSILKKLENPNFFSVNKARRMNGALKNLGIGLGVLAYFSVVTDNAVLAKNIALPSPQVQEALDDFLTQYRYAYEEAFTTGGVSKSRWINLSDALDAYMTTAGYSDSVKNTIRFEFLQIEAGK